MHCGTLRHFGRQDAGVYVDDEPGPSVFRADVRMYADGVLPRPFEQRAAIGDANPGVITGSTRVTAIDDPLGSRESLLNGDLPAAQEGEHAVRDVRVVIEILSRHGRCAQGSS
jgi:hypothetical protein